jgi:hypothetical protein
MKKSEQLHKDHFGFFDNLERLAQPVEREDYKMYYIPSGELVHAVSDYGHGYFAVKVYKLNSPSLPRLSILSADDSGASAWGNSSFELVDGLISKYWRLPSLEELTHECSQIGLTLDRW